MKTRTLTLSMIAAAAVMGVTTGMAPTPANADPNLYIQCTQWALFSCENENPHDAVAWEACYYDRVETHCAGLPGDPNG